MNKTKAELEDDNYWLKLYLIAFIGLLIFSIIMLAFSTEEKIDLKSQLAECQRDSEVNLIELKHLAFTGSNLRFYIDGMEVINHTGTVSFWVKVLKQDLPFGEVYVWNRTMGVLP